MGLVIPMVVSGIMQDDIIGELREIGHRNGLGETARSLRWIAVADMAVRLGWQDLLRWIAFRQKYAIHEAFILDAITPIASVDFGQGELHSAEVRPPRNVDVHSGRASITRLDQVLRIWRFIGTRSFVRSMAK
ncbi:hypothetical protein AAFG13_38660 [Bradyrhizobium sp. B124]|uniref:hypothetical protein n=1 Tax=Bradyrhizobium sp. B124 TaxID=3140245 RepID=UPI0031834C68